MTLRHVVKSQQFDLDFLQIVFNISEFMESVVRNGGSRALNGKTMATLFYEPSTRTRLSFEAAMLHLGGGVISTENAGKFSSAAKGESLEDTIRIVAGYADVIVLRHTETGAADRAAAVDAVPIINAGDGSGQHPTQALLDLYTIRRELGNIDGVSIAFVGDLKYGRTVKSLAYLLAKFPVGKMRFVAPEDTRITEGIKEYLDRHGVTWEETDDLAAAMREADAVYVTRIQKERFANEEEYARANGKLIVTPELVAGMKPKSCILHPLPRVNELDPAVDSDPRAAYFRQARNGLFVRMALLTMMLGKG